MAELEIDGQTAKKLLPGGSKDNEQPKILSNIVLVKSRYNELTRATYPTRRSFLLKSYKTPAESVSANSKTNQAVVNEESSGSYSPEPESVAETPNKRKMVKTHSGRSNIPRRIKRRRVNASNELSGESISSRTRSKSRNRLLTQTNKKIEVKTSKTELAPKKSKTSIKVTPKENVTSASTSKSSIPTVADNKTTKSDNSTVWLKPKKITRPIKKNVPLKSSVVEVGESSRNITPSVSLTSTSETFIRSEENIASANSLLTQPNIFNVDKSDIEEPNEDSDTDTSSEITSLQVLLEARGLPSHLFDSTFGSVLNSRMHTLLNSNISGNNVKVRQLLLEMQSNNEVKILKASSEICQILVMGNEDSLMDFPVSDVVSTLITLLNMEDNFNVMNNACRGLGYMLEVLPHSAGLVVSAIPIFLQKLLVIECMDVAEQSLIVLEMLSRRFNKSILSEKGVSICLLYLDFFSLNAQRSALAITANCCLNLKMEEYHYVKDSLSIMTPLLIIDDRKCIESVCMSFCRIVDSFCTDPTILEEIAGNQWLKNVQLVLTMSPPVLNSLIFSKVIRMLSKICFVVPSTIETFMKNNIASTVLFLLTGSSESLNVEEVDIKFRSSTELLEITSLIIELLPRLPTEGIFAIEHLLEVPLQLNQAPALYQWQYTDDAGKWQSYSPSDSFLIEQGHFNGEEELNIVTDNKKCYSIDFTSMIQMDAVTGSIRAIKRVILPSLVNPQNKKNRKNKQNVVTAQIFSNEYGDFIDSSDNSEDKNKRMIQFVKKIFPVLYKVLSSSAGPDVNYKSLRAILRMIHIADGEILQQVLPIEVISSHITSLLAARDSRIVSNAMLISDMLITKLPDIFSTLFYREGVINQLKKLSDLSIPLEVESNTDLHLLEPSVSSQSTLKYIPKTFAQVETSSSQSRFAGTSSNIPCNLATVHDWGRSSRSPFSYSKESVIMPNAHEANIIMTTKLDKIKKWIRTQSGAFLIRHAEVIESKTNTSQLVLTRLSNVVLKFEGNHEDVLGALDELKSILMTVDVSPFEVNHSGLIQSLINLLTATSGIMDRNDRLRLFLHTFAGLPLDSDYSSDIADFDSAPFKTLVLKLNYCVTQMEQFTVKVHNLPIPVDVRSNDSTLSFLNTHQLKCILQRHPKCKNLQQWRDGTIKIEPLATIQTIEKYLTVRGYANVLNSNSVDHNSILPEIALTGAFGNNSPHRLELLIGDNVLPYNISVFQAIRDYSHSSGPKSSEYLFNQIWQQNHVIHYRLAEIKDQAPIVKTTPNKSLAKRKTDFWLDCNLPEPMSPLTPYLIPQLPDKVKIEDPSLDIICLLRILHALNRHWTTLYFSVPYVPLISKTEFIHAKITAKASQPLQDPLVIMTSTLPCWLKQLSYSCPFLFPFETRQLLFHVISFDRDRALQRIMGTNTLNSVATADRITPHLDRRKKTISRDDILKQAESIMRDFAHSKAMLEIQYENEVGTGLGPTLEFYSLVSNALKQRNLGLWNDSDSYNSVAVRKTKTKIEKKNENIEGKELSNHDLYVNAPFGLFPVPFGKVPKRSVALKARYKFRFLGKFIAKAIWDNRMFDLSFSMPFYRWLLGEETYLSMSDLSHIVPDIYKILSGLKEVVKQRDIIKNDSTLDEKQKAEEIKNLNLNGCLIHDLGLDFILPGHSHIELRRGGRNMAVTIHNLHQYISLVTHWFLIEGVSRQFDSFREGFNSVFPVSALKIFYPDELESMFCGSIFTEKQNWSMEMLAESCRTDHGYNKESITIKYFFEILSNYTAQEQRLFLQFITGTPRLPTGGFKAFKPPLTIVQKKVEEYENADDFLPSVMTCVNYLKLPEYSSLEVMRKKLEIAAKEGTMCFHLS